MIVNVHELICLEPLVLRMLISTHYTTQLIPQHVFHSPMHHLREEDISEQTN